MKKRVLLIAALFGVALLAACGGGGGGGETTLLASSDVTVNGDRTTGPAMAQSMSGETFTFSGGVPDFGTTTTTTTTITASSSTATPTFSISSGGNTASGVLEFGSCIFRVTSSNFPVTSPLAVGRVTIISACQFVIRTRALVADGIARERGSFFRLNSAISEDTLVTVTISSGGVVSVNGQVVGNVSVTPVTGGA